MTFVCLIYLVFHFTSYPFLSLFNAVGDHFEKPSIITGGPSSKYEHRHCGIPFELNRSVGGEKPIVSVTYRYERISTEKKHGLPYLKCVLGISCVIREPIYVHFMGFSVTGFLSKKERIPYFLE